MIRSHAFEVLGFVPATAHFGKEIWVDCYAVDPRTKLLRRKRYRCNLKGQGRAARKAFAVDLVDKLNRELRSGWNPWVKPLPAREARTLESVLIEYLRVIERTTSNRSPLSYRSNVTRLLAWCVLEKIHDAPVESFTWKHALAYMDQIRDVRKVGNTTFNNYLQYGLAMFNWMIERGYREDNPFKRVKRMRKVQKRRVLITQIEFKQCLDWFRVHHPEMVTVCLLVFHTLLRPRSELLRIKVRDVDLAQGVINVDGKHTKSKRVRQTAIAHAVKDYLIRTGLGSVPGEFYLVGKGLRPSIRPSGYNYMGLLWDKMRKALNWGSEKQMYSLRDSGIVQLITDGVDLHVVMRQADHSSLEVTNRYVQHYFADSAKQVQDRATTVIDESFNLPRGAKRR